MGKVRQMNDISGKRIEKKPVFSVRNAFLFFAQFVIIVGIVSYLIIYVKIPVGNLYNLSLISMVPVQTTISLLAITILQIVLPDRKKRIFGVTYQNILFKWKVLKYFNALDCMMYMLLLMIINILLAVVSVIAKTCSVQNICKLCFMCLIIESFILTVYMIYLGLITKFKNSRIYYLLYKRMSKRNVRSEEIYNMLLKGMKDHAFNANPIRREYLNYEVAILEYMFCYLNDFKLFDMNRDEARQLIKKEKNDRLRMRKWN